MIALAVIALALFGLALLGLIFWLVRRSTNEAHPAARANIDVKIRIRSN